MVITLSYKKNMMKITLQIQNLKCGGCENTIINNISKLEGVSASSVNQENLQLYLNITLK